MHEFLKIERIEPMKRPSNERTQHYREIYETFTAEESASQASRCIQCGNPYCSSTGCPLANHIPQWLQYIADKDLEMAFRISNESSPYPEILGRICPHGRLCEGACTLEDGHGAVTIGAVEVSISEKGFAAGYTPDFHPLDTGKKVAIIGSGPAGMSCANFLLRAGVKPVVFERADQAGGLLTYGIPGFKLEKAAVERRLKLLQDGGMELRLNTEVGKDVPFGQIYEQYDAVFVAIGATEGRTLDHEGYNSDNLYMAVSFLTNIQKKNEERPFDSKYDVTGKDVIVVGGGDTAMDCVRTSIREGAKSVRCLYRRDEAAMPGSPREVQAAKEEGVQFVWNRSPKGFVADKSGKVYGAKFVQTQIEPDQKGRGRVVEIDGTEETLEADAIILALGFNNSKLSFLKENGIEMTEYGSIIVDEQGRTSKARVYAGGDGVRGADLAVTAALDGRTVAEAIIEAIFVEEEAASVE